MIVNIPSGGIEFLQAETSSGNTYLYLAQFPEHVLFCKIRDLVAYENRSFIGMTAMLIATRLLVSFR